MYRKLKSLITDDAFFMAILLLLVGIVSFGLGRQSLAEDANSPKSQPAGIVFSESEEKFVEKSSGFQVLGSRSGTKYHLPECSGAKRIKEENKVFFDSVELAKAAGYTPAANCPGLE